MDRVDSDRGYSITNVVACCWDCNRAKGSLTTEEFLAWVARVHRWSVARRQAA
jgi:5-methylcytosine-specific restriction endonuclease McrA